MAQTANYHLPLYESYDKPTHTGLNANQQQLETIFNTLETAINTKASQTDVDALTARIEVVAGSYKGDVQKTKRIELGFTPKAVLVESSFGLRNISNRGVAGGLALPNLPSQYATETSLEIVTGGFQVGYISGSIYTNGDNTYRYLAFK